MRPRFSLLCIVLALMILALLGGAVLGYLGSTYYETSTRVMVAQTAGVLRYVLQSATELIALGVLAGGMGWLIMFAMRRDGWHRMERVTLMPQDYPGAPRFDNRR